MKIIERYLLLWLVLLSGVALVYPRVLPGAADPFLVSAPWLWYLIAVTMFAIGWLLPREELRQVGRRWPTVLYGTAVQYITMPLLAWSVATALGLEGPVRTGVIIVGCVPGAMASNVLTLLARGNVSYSLCLTTSATLLSPLVVPLTLTIALGTYVQLGWSTVAVMALRLLLAVVIPVVCGHLAGRCLPQWDRHARVVGSTVANLAILWIIAVVVAKNRENLQQIDTTLFAALAGVNLLGYGAGYTGGWAFRLPEPMRRALTLEIGMQNAGLGATMAATFFSAEAAIAPALYTFGCMLTGSILAKWWALRGTGGDRPAEPE